MMLMSIHGRDNNDSMVSGAADHGGLHLVVTVAEQGEDIVVI